MFAPANTLVELTGLLAGSALLQACTVREDETRYTRGKQASLSALFRGVSISSCEAAPARPAAGSFRLTKIKFSKAAGPSCGSLERKRYLRLQLSVPEVLHDGSQAADLMPFLHTGLQPVVVPAPSGRDVRSKTVRAIGDKPF